MRILRFDSLTDLSRFCTNYTPLRRMKTRELVQHLIQSAGKKKVHRDRRFLKRRFRSIVVYTKRVFHTGITDEKNTLVGVLESEGLIDKILRIL